jgi:4-hydroxybenzoate polyprenyltransferase
MTARQVPLKENFWPFIELMRLDKRTGLWLLLWPCWWSIGLAPVPWAEKGFYGLIFAFGAVIMRSAGCVINDIWDRNIDPHVERTRHRPLARGAVSVEEALVLLAVLMALGLSLLLALNRLTILIGVVFAVMVVVYPLMKRVLAMPQIFLGLTINAGAVMGWTAVTGSLGWPPLWLFIACFFWTLGYDTIYAHQDKTDDRQIGVKSSALVLGERTKAYLMLYYCLMAAFLVLSGWQVNMLWPFYIGLFALALHLVWQIATVNLDKRADCMNTFRANGWAGWLLLMGLIGADMLSKGA